MTVPVVRGISPTIPCSRDVFPEPTGPTIATRRPFGIIMEISYNLKAFWIESTDFSLVYSLLFSVSVTSGVISSHEKELRLTSSAFKRLRSRVIMSSDCVSASNTSVRRLTAFEASAIALNAIAETHNKLSAQIY